MLEQPREFRDGAKDGLEALEPLDPDKIETFSDLLTAMRKAEFGGRRNSRLGSVKAMGGVRHEH